MRPAIWLLYDDPDYTANRDFAALMRGEGERRGLLVEPVLASQLTLGFGGDGRPFCLRRERAELPAAVFSRQRDSLVSRHFERMGVPVLNGSRVCEICNDKRRTHQFLSKLPMPQTLFLRSGMKDPPEGTRFPVVVKPADSHGGDRVTLVHTAGEWRAAVGSIFPGPAVQQAVVSGAGRDLRVYVVFGQTVAGVMRAASDGIVSNYKRGGSVRLHTLTDEERALAGLVIRRFEQAGAPLYLAGVDLLYDGGRPVVGEVEDVVGSRMLYQTSELNIASMFLDAFLDHFANLI